MRFAVLLGFGACLLAAAGAAHAQISVFVEGSADQMSNQHTSHTAFGPTFGADAEFYRAGHARVYGDLRGFYYNGKGVEAGSNRLQLGGFEVGPKIGFAFKHVEPYAEFLVGFARYNDGLGNSNSSTTDGQLDGVFGIDVRLTTRFDYRVFEFDYKRFSAIGGEFNPKILSTGVVFHLGRR